MFEKASRLKLRFETSKGQLTVEDLWDLPLTAREGRASLDEVAKSLHRKLKSDENISFVTPEKAEDETPKLMFEIVKHIISVRLEEQKQASEARTKAEKRQMILSLIERKQTETLSAASEEDLRKMLAEL